MNGNNQKKFEAVYERINQKSSHLQNQIDHALTLEDNIKMMKEDVKHVQDQMLRTKTDMTQSIVDMRNDFLKNKTANDNLENRMEQVLADSKYWLEKYTKAYKDNDAKIGELQGEFNGCIESVEFVAENLAGLQS